MQENNSDYPQKKPRRQRKDISAWEQTLRWLDARWYSESKLREKLNRLAYGVDEIEEVLNKCREYNLVNDAALAEEFARSQSSRGRGSRRIACELYRHGLTGDAARSAIEKITGNDAQAAQSALQSKLAGWKNQPDWRKRREKAFQFLARRGFPLDIIYSTLDEDPTLNGNMFED